MRNVPVLSQITYIMDPLMQKFDVVLKLNREVHSERYNTLIAEAVSLTIDDAAATAATEA